MVLPFTAAASKASYYFAVANRVRRERDQSRLEIRSELQKLAAAIPIQQQKYILSLNATQLAEHISTNQLQSTDVVTLYCWRALQAGEILDCNAEELFIDAINQAKQDDIQRNNKRKQGNLKDGELLPGSRLLEGVPVSVKDAYIQSHCLSTCGCASKAEHRYDTDGLLVSLLRAQGAIPYVRTNVPQSLMLPETDCQIWGQAKNAYDHKRSPGGSSGGEGALLSVYGSVLGIGTDIGGSVRIPASMSGITAFKPTPARQTIKGMDLPRKKAYDGIFIKNACGAMSRSVDDVITLTKCWWSEPAYIADPYIPRLPFNDTVYNDKKPLRIGYYLSDNVFESSPGHKRVVLECVELLRAAGHTVVEFKPPAVTYNLVVAWGGLVGSDGGKDQLDGQDGETPNIMYTASKALPFGLPQAAGKLVRTALRYTGHSRVADFADAAQERPTHEYIQYISRVLEWRDQYLAEWKAQQLDCLLTPSTGLPAMPHSSASKLFTAVSYTMLWNMLEYPAGVVPVSTVRGNECDYTDTFNDFITAAAKQALRGATGLPLGIQVSALPYQDEIVLKIMKQIETNVNFYAQNQPTLTMKQIR